MDRYKWPIFGENQSFLIFKSSVCCNQQRFFVERHHSHLICIWIWIRNWFAKLVTNNFTLPKYFGQVENLLSKSHSFTENDNCTFLESEIKFIANDLKRVWWVEWDNQNNEFVFHYSSLIDLARSLETTKRNVLKISTSFYDPLGIISPITARLKTISQLPYNGKLHWDGKAPIEIAIVWNEFLSHLENWNCLKVFAFSEIEESIFSFNIQGPCNSSNKIYCVVLYLCIETSFGIRVSLLVYKAQVIP